MLHSQPSWMMIYCNGGIRLDWFSRPPASVEHASASLCAHFVCVCLSVCKCLHMQVCAYLKWVHDEKQNSFNLQCGRKFHKGFYTKHLLNLGSTPSSNPLCTALEGLFMFSLPSQVPENDLFQLQNWSFIFPFNMSLIQHTCCWWLKCLLLNHCKAAAAERRLTSVSWNHKREKL